MLPDDSREERGARGAARGVDGERWGESRGVYRRGGVQGKGVRTWGGERGARWEGERERERERWRWRGRESPRKSEGAITSTSTVIGYIG